MAGAPPPPDFDQASLDLQQVVAGTVFGRLYVDVYPDPLGFGLAPSRFSDPRGLPDAERFGVLYLGSSLPVCFLEAILRDQRDGTTGDFPVAESELRSRSYARIEAVQPLSLVDLTGNGRVRMGVPSDVVGASDQTLARLWSAAFHDHPDGVDGILYPSRINGETNLAVFGRAVGKLAAREVRPLIGTPGLATVLDTFRIALV